jgi:hypothetical protein
MQTLTQVPAVLKATLTAGILAMAFAPSLAQSMAQEASRAETEFYQGYYLQHERNDLKKAIEAYQRSIAFDANAATRSAVDAEMANIQEELATADFAQIMPGDAFAFLEISNPADHVEQLARLMGLTGREFSPTDTRAILRIEDELAISSDFQLSPALLRELKKIRGAALAITEVYENRPPNGVLVIHPGDSDLVTGIVETGIQLVPATEKIEGFPTFQIEKKVWIVKTNRLIIVSADKAQIVNCVKRISDPKRASLADQKKFKSSRNEHQNAAVFAFVDPARALEKMRAGVSRELAMARMILDLDHINHVTAILTTTDAGLVANVDIDFAADHNSLAYGLIRTVPLTGKSLSHVPSGSAAVAGMGLNPQMRLAAEIAGSRHLTALDIGREIFANIEELSCFILPSTVGANHEMPDFGLVIASNDIEKSAALWNTLLTLPSTMNIKEGPQAKRITIDGITARRYSWPNEKGAPQIVIARLNDQALIAGTEAAVNAAIQAGKTGKTLAQDNKAQSLWQTKSEHTAKAVFVHVGRMLRLAAMMNNGNDGQQMEAVSRVVDDLTITLVFNESPAHFEAKLNAVGLPGFENIIKMMAKFENPNRPAKHPAEVTSTGK